MKRFKRLAVTLFCALSVFLFACAPLQRIDTGTGDNPDNPIDPVVPEYVTPVVRIVTQNNAPVVSKEEYLNATVTLTDGGSTVTLDSVSAGVRGRGNYTWTLDKKGYRIKFDKKQAMLSDYKCKSWALLPNLTDKTLLRNYYAFQVARRMEGLPWATDAKLVELYLNNEYLGVYLLCDQTQVNPNRVNVEEGSLFADTGFLIERDRYAMEDPELVEGRDYFTIPEDYFYAPSDEYVSGALPYVLKSPEYPDRGDYDTQYDFEAAESAYMEQFRFIKERVTNAYRAVQSKDFDAFCELCDVNSFVDYFMLDQVFANYEIDRFSSFYLHKDKGGKLKAGPVWDFDIAAGYSIPESMHNLRKCNTWFIPFASNNEFMSLYANRLKGYSSMIYEEGQKLYAVANKNKDAIERNNKKWPIETYIYPMNDVLSSMKTYSEQLDFLVNYVRERCYFLNMTLSKYTDI